MLKRLLSLVALMAIWTPPAVAQGQRLEACARGNVQVCLALLARPRLEPGRRAAIEFHLAELQRLLDACLAGEAPACTTLGESYPELPPELSGRKLPSPANEK